MIELTASAELLTAMQAVASAFDRMAAALERYAAPGTAPASNEATPPPPPPPAQWAKPGHWCTPERKDVLRSLYPTTATPQQIRGELERCNGGGGLPSWDNIGTYCLNVLKIHRPRPITDPTPITVDATSLRVKAAEWGIHDDHETTANVLVQVNEKAARIGHRPYELQQRKSR